MNIAPKPANYYASVTAIPDYVETAILTLNSTEKLKFASDLIYAIKGGFPFNARTPEATWLNSQPYDSLLSVLKWVTSELL
jgi:hypothetical protein